jgi:folate-binding protein YgfZ
MKPLALHDLHSDFRASFTLVNGLEAVDNYGDVGQEHSALVKTAAVLDLSFRSRLCVVGKDRVRFLHGQVTNDINSLRPGSGCYAALVTAKGRLQSDLNIYNLGEEVLLDFEPGLSMSVFQRLEKYIVADDVQVVGVEPLYGLLSLQGPLAEKVIGASSLFPDVPVNPFSVTELKDDRLGQVYLMNQPRLRTKGFDLFVPNHSLRAFADRLIAAARSFGGGVSGWQALEVARIEAGVPRFGIDMDETNFPQESGIEADAVSYSKGCYIGQEILNRLHTMGHVNRELRGLRLDGQTQNLPVKGDKLFFRDQEVGYITSAAASPVLKANVALAYVRRDLKEPGTVLLARTKAGEVSAVLVRLPFRDLSLISSCAGGNSPG